MADVVAFHSQVASIMEVLANAAVAEICKLADEGFALLRWEVNQREKENEELRRRISAMEKKELADVEEVVPGSPLVSKEKPKEELRRKENMWTGKERAVQPAPDGHQRTAFPYQQTALTDSAEDAGDELRSRCTVWESGDVERNGPESALIKEERLEKEPWTKKPPGGERIAREGTLEANTGNEDSEAILDPQATSEENHEEEEHRVTRVQGLSGLEAVYRPEPEDTAGNQDFQHLGSGRGSERASRSCSQYRTCGDSSRARSLFTENRGSSYCYAADVDSGGLVATLSQGAGNAATSLAGLDWKPDVVLIDAAPVKLEVETDDWNGEDADQRCYEDNDVEF
ncbi:hypothetical protein GN956_G12865 [Arapaima gigas]